MAVEKAQTAVPWYVYKVRSSKGHPPTEIQIRDANHNIIAVVAHYGEHAGAPLGSAREAIAEHIIACVNSCAYPIGENTVADSSNKTSYCPHNNRTWDADELWCWDCGKQVLPQDCKDEDLANGEGK